MMDLLEMVLEGDALTPEEFIELRKMRLPRPKDYEVQRPNVTDQCQVCGNRYPVELAVIHTWSPMTIACPECYVQPAPQA